MADVAALAGGYYGVHLGSEGDQLIEELQKALYIGRQAKIPVHVYHLKARGRHNWAGAGGDRHDRSRAGGGGGGHRESIPVHRYEPSVGDAAPALAAGRPSARDHR